ncbi:MAG: hypothetical protein R2699_07230 [Acidimicrobiales bacterium]
MTTRPPSWRTRSAVASSVGAAPVPAVAAGRGAGVVPGGGTAFGPISCTVASSVSQCWCSCWATIP